MIETRSSFSIIVNESSANVHKLHYIMYLELQSVSFILGSIIVMFELFHCRTDDRNLMIPIRNIFLIEYTMLTPTKSFIIIFSCDK